MNVTHRVRRGWRSATTLCGVDKARPTYEQRAHRRAFGDRVQTLRHEHNWTQERLAERAELHRSYVAGIESGARNPTLDVIVKLAHAFHVSPAALFEE